MIFTETFLAGCIPNYSDTSSFRGSGFIWNIPIGSYAHLHSIWVHVSRELRTWLMVLTGGKHRY